MIRADFLELIGTLVLETVFEYCLSKLDFGVPIKSIRTDGPYRRRTAALAEEEAWQTILKIF